MALWGFNAAARAEEEPLLLMRKSVRVALLVLGVLLMGVGLPLALLPGHIGIFFFAVGLIIVLRNSFSAKRNFIRAQRRHPNIVFPIRRLIRREPEVIPVAWQQTLRLEQLLLRPRRFRFMRRLRLMLMRRRPHPAS